MLFLGPMAQRVVLCVSNDLLHDQRVHKVALSLRAAGYQPWLVGRRRRASQPLPPRPYHWLRLPLHFEQGKLFYLELNLRLLWLLLRMRTSIITANDLDTLPACYLAALLKRIPLVYDSHEYFTGASELARRPLERRIWRLAEQLLLPLLPTRITVTESVRQAYQADGYDFALIRNLPLQQPAPHPAPSLAPHILLYQGMLNEGRGLHWLVEALPLLPGWQAWVVGDGVLRPQLEAQAQALGVAHRIRFWGMVPFEQLPGITSRASIGLSIEDPYSLNNRYSAPNKLYDYLQARLPVVVSPQPEHSALVQQQGVGAAMPDYSAAALAQAVQQVADNYTHYQAATHAAATTLCWQQQEATLLHLYAHAQPPL